MKKVFLCLFLYTEIDAIDDAEFFIRNLDKIYLDEFIVIVFYWFLFLTSVLCQKSIIKKRQVTWSDILLNR